SSRSRRLPVPPQPRTDTVVTPRLSVRTSDGRMFRLVRPFVIGRELDCDVRIEDGRVSRKHVEVSIDDGRWIVRDRQSGNGVFVNGKRIESATVDRALTITLGADGPSVTLEVEAPAVPVSARPPAPGAGGETMMYVERYVNAIDAHTPAVQRTLTITNALQKGPEKKKPKDRRNSP